MTPIGPSSRRAVLLLHEGFGAPHIDLLLERDDGPLATFRAPVGISLALGPAQTAAFEAERSPDHRRVYLDYEGPVSNQRGTVRRVATLTLHAFVETPGAIAFAASTMPGPGDQAGITDWTARPDSRGLWRFEGRGRLDEPAAIAGVPR
ncbi:MAG TPA: hypothetical protein VF777_10035 [Phycisphaerales bacterium]